LKPGRELKIRASKAERKDFDGKTVGVAERKAGYFSALIRCGNREEAAKEAGIAIQTAYKYERDRSFKERLIEASGEMNSYLYGRLFELVESSDEAVAMRATEALIAHIGHMTGEDTLALQPQINFNVVNVMQELRRTPLGAAIADAIAVPELPQPSVVPDKATYQLLPEPPPAAPLEAAYKEESDDDPHNPH
jgi:hypothetical protein